MCETSSIGGERSYLDVIAPHIHICNRSGPDEGPLFYQYEAWPVREMVMDHLVRLVRYTHTHTNRNGGNHGD